MQLQYVMSVCLCVDMYKWGGREGRRRVIGSTLLYCVFQLLDVVRRLDAATASGFSDGVAEGEATALRLLINVC